MRAHGRRQHLEQQAFTHAVGREHDRLRLGDADDVFQHQRCIGQQRPPCFGHGLDIGENITRREPSQTADEIQRLGSRDRIAVHYAQRIRALDDVDACQRAPCAADRVKISARTGGELRHAVERGLDDALGTLGGFMRGVLKRERAERQRHALADRIALDVDEFK